MKINYNYIKEKYDHEILAEDIILIKNFINDEELQTVLNYVTDITEENWSVTYWESIKYRVKLEYDTDDYQKLIDEGIVFINPNIVDKVSNIPIHDLSKKWYSQLTECFTETHKLLDSANDFCSVTRHYPGSWFDYHVDSQGFDGKGDRDVYYTAVIYYTDDYTGGELHFPNFNVSFKPPAKSLVIFNSGLDYKHGVKTIESGNTRYVSAIFLRNKGDVINENN